LGRHVAHPPLRRPLVVPRRRHEAATTRVTAAFTKAETELRSRSSGEEAAGSQQAAVLPWIFFAMPSVRWNAQQPPASLRQQRKIAWRRSASSHWLKTSP
jgi:hypothetical protein